MKEIPVIFENDGKIVGLLRKVKKPKGLVILVHGFTGTIDGPAGTSWIKLSKALAKKKFDVYRFNFRFTGPEWEEFHKMTVAGEVSDLKKILKIFSKKYKKIGVVGESLGGAVSILALNKSTNCLVLWYPVIDLMKTAIPERFNTASALKELEEKDYVTIEKGSTGEPIRVGKKFIMENVIEIFFTNLYKKLKGISCPVLIVSPDKDTIVPFWQSEKAIELFKTKNKDLVKVKNSDHAWWKPGRELRDWDGEKLAIRKTVDWLNRWLNL
jgi:esterase/lipase